MTDLVSLGNLLAGGGVAAVVTALIGAVVGRRPRQADYTKALVDIAGDITKRADERAQSLEDKVTRLETQIDELDSQLGTLSDLLRTAIPLLQTAGHVEIAADMRAALVRRAV